MRHIYAFLTLCHKTWPTPDAVKHNITLGTDMRLNVSIFKGGKWYRFQITEDGLARPAELVAGMASGFAEQEA